MLLKQKTILITGASSGIGEALARQLATAQNRLLLVARREELLEQLVSQLPPHPQGHRFFVGDVADADRVRQICGQILEAGITLDVLILNAGVGGGFQAMDIDLDSFRRQIEVNFFGAVYFIKYLIPSMLMRGEGIIAVNGSLAGYRGVPKAAAYSSAKGALMNFIESLRIDLHSSHLQCTLISPGFVKTPMTDLNDYVMPFMISADKAARIILRGLECGKSEIAFPLPLVLAAKIGRLLPNKLYTRMMQSSRKVKR
ncbi:MAG: SDR family NAD(P)-dependent oxidoreductase [Calditrichaeota bacterium]|nr:MAG: SDR family NAD(P)-dependent oxidoreductase [Calditrichota bacterium]